MLAGSTQSLDMGSGISRRLRAPAALLLALAVLSSALQVLRAELFDDPIDQDAAVQSKSSDSHHPRRPAEREQTEYTSRRDVGCPLSNWRSGWKIYR